MGRPAIHPGEILIDELEELGMTSSDLAGILGVSTERLDQILKGASPITAEIALRLSQWLGTGAECWMNLQSSYDLRLAEQEIGEEIRREVVPRAGIPLSEPGSSHP